MEAGNLFWTIQQLRGGSDGTRLERVEFLSIARLQSLNITPREKTTALDQCQPAWGVRAHVFGSTGSQILLIPFKHSYIKH